VADAPHASDGRFVYAGTCRNLTPAEVAEKSRHRHPAYRLRLPDEVISFTDGHYGPQQYNLAKDWGDIIIRRSDGVFAYQLAVTIDDGLQGRDAGPSAAEICSVPPHRSSTCSAGSALPNPPTCTCPCWSRPTAPAWPSGKKPVTQVSSVPLRQPRNP
jgi:hypothetical protein